jgi:hypothetical protein
MAAKQSMFSDVSGEFACMPSRVWRYALAYSLLQAVTDWIAWWSGRDLAAIDYVAFSVAFAAFLAMSYAASFAMVSREPDILSFRRFTAVLTILLSPMFLGIACILVRPAPSSGTTLGVGFSLIVIGWLLVTFLPAAPLAQALSAQPISPIAIFKATRGHRWSLVLLSFVTTSVNRFVPSTSAATGSLEAALLAIGNGLVTTLTTLFGVCIGVAAWRVAARTTVPN